MRTFCLSLAFCCVALARAQVTCDDMFELVGTASLQGDCIRLTANSTSQQGCAWFPNLIDFSQPFTHTMTLSFGSNNGGADGICMIYQTNGTNECGSIGGGIAALGINNSFIIEMDTWDNNTLHNDIPNDHIAVAVNGLLTNTIAGPYDLGNIEDGADHTVTFDWDPVGNIYEVSFDGNLIFSASYDIINNCFGGSTMAYWGFSSSTGAATNSHQICPEMPPEVTASAGPDIELPCPGASLMLDGTGSDSGSDFSYSWSTFNGNIVSGGNTATPTVDDPGTYILTVTNTVTNCESIDEVTVTQNEVEAFVFDPPFLDCYSGFVTLDGTTSTSGADISYTWSTPDGNIQSTNGAQATVDEPGTYTLTVTYDDGLTICTDEASVQVFDDPNVPMAFAYDSFILCDPPSTQLDGSESSQGGLYSYQWTTTNGFIVSGATTLFPTVGAPGVYTLVVTNDVSGCTAEYGVFVNPDQDLPDAIATADEQLSCTESEVSLNGSLSSQGSGFSYQWTTANGNIVSGAATLFPVVGMQGDYTLLVTDIGNGCTDMTTVSVTGSFDNPLAAIAPPTPLTCTTEMIVLDGSGSDQGASYSYQWTTTNGQIEGATDGLQITASAPGQYILAVSSLDSDCVGMDTVLVSENIVMPVAEAGTAEEIGCGDTSIALDGTGSSTGAMGEYSYQWTTTNGNIVSGANGLMPNVNAPGLYQLEVTHLATGCSMTDIVEVQGDASTPIVLVDVSDTLNCSITIATLDASASSQGANFDFAWSTNNGNFDSGQNSLQPMVDQPGSYTLAITNTDNNCTTAQTVSVVIDTIAPIAAVATPLELNCSVATANLDGAASSQGAEFEYQWSTTDGVIVGPTDSLQTTAAAPGTYDLLVTDSSNSCEVMASMQVSQDTIAPNVSIADPDMLNCATSNIEIDATSSSQGTDFSYLWTTINGSLQGDSTTLSPMVNTPGTYTLAITNQNNLCVSTSEVTVLEDNTPPVAATGSDLTLDCFAPEQNVGDVATSSGPNFAYSWTTASGQINGASDSLTASVQAAGLYVLSVLNTNNGCSASDSVLVTTDFAEPLASIALPGFLTCTDSLVILDATASSDGSIFSYAWSTMDGNVLAGGSTLEPTVSQAGDYELLITNTENGCTASASTSVMQDENFPNAGIATPALLTCDETIVTLAASASSQSGNVDFSWMTTDGQFASGENTLMPTVDAPGTYMLQVTDLDNNCQALAAVEVILDDEAPAIEIAEPDILTCASTSIFLDASGSSQGAEMVYQWTTGDGQIVSGDDSLMPSIDAPGTYALLITDTSNGCTADNLVAVMEDVVEPQIDIATPSVLNCALTSTSLDAANSDSGPNFSFSWTTTDGTITTGEDGAFPTIAAAGTYELLLTNTVNGCGATASVEVMEDLSEPTVVVAASEVLTCAHTQVALSSMGSDTGTNFTYEWSTGDGNLLDPADSPAPQVDAPGTYLLLITNTENGCSNSAQAEVLQDIVEPVIDFDPATLLSCATTSSTLVALPQMAGNNPAFSWSTASGQIDSDPTLAQIDVSSPGTYALMLTNTNNGCSAMAELMVEQDTISPQVMIAEPEVLTCSLLEQNLDASASSSQANLSYDWSTLDGQIINGATSLTPAINAPGTYELLILNEDNGCSATDAIEVLLDTIAPVVMIAIPDTLDCQTTALNLDAAGSSSGASFSLAWSTTGGQISSGGNSLMPTIEASGTYALLITNEENDCTAEASVAVAQDDEVPVVAIAEPAMLNCLVQEFNLDAGASSSGPNFEPSWSTADGEIQEGANTFNPVITEPGTYTLTIVNSENLCEESADIVVLEDVIPPVANAGLDFTLPCFSETSTLDGNQSSQGTQFTYEWTALAGTILQGDQSLAPSIDGAGTFELLITNTENGCTASDQVVVDQDVPTATAAIQEPLCFGETGAIAIETAQGGTPPYLYSINGGESFQTTPFFSTLPAGVYDLVVQDVNACEYAEALSLDQPDSLTVVVTEPEVTIALGETHAIFAQVNVPIEELVSINWEHNGTLDCDDCLDPVAKPDETTVYRVTVQNANGCQDEAVMRLFVERSRPVYIPTAFSPDGDGINDFFMIFARIGVVHKVHSLEVFNRWGESVFTVFDFQANDPAAGWDGNFRGKTLNPGVFAYVARIEFIDGEIEVLKGEVILIR